MTSMNGSEETNPTTGDNVTDISVNMDGGVGGSWKQVTHKVIADNLIEQVAELLGGTAKYYTCSDKKTQHKKIVIEYDHSNNLH